MPASLEQLVVPLGSSIEIPGVSLQSLGESELASLTRFAEIRQTVDSVQISTRGKRRVGRVRIGGHILVIQPPLPADLFVTLVSFASGDIFEKFAEREGLPAEITRKAREDEFLKLLAALFVKDAEGIVGRHIARQYISRTERLRTIRGRIAFRDNFGHHLANGITCHHNLLETNVLLNQLILAGLLAAQELLRASDWHSRAVTQLFLWRGVASDTNPSPLDFEIANRNISRLTEHYREPLRIAYSLLFGNMPADLLAGARGRLQALEFDLAHLFERLVARLVMMLGRKQDLLTRTQQVARRAIVNAKGETYRRAIPDICLFRNRVGVGIIDAKYKPRYMDRGKQGKPRKGSRVSNADLYQMFFYQAVMRSRNVNRQCPRGGIAVPILDEGKRMPSEEWLEIQWSGDSQAGEAYGIQLIPIRLVPVLRAIMSGDRSALHAATPELREFLSSLAV